MFEISSFIYAYASTDRAIRIIDTAGKIVHTINICNYQKSGVFGAKIIISMEDQFEPYELMFDSNTSAKTALNYFKNTVNTLKPNCKVNFNGGSLPTPGTAVAITYTAFKALQVSNTLVPMQWYEITDTANNLFATGTRIIRVLALETNDSHIRGQVVGTHEYVVFDCVLDKITHYDDSVKNITIVNGTPNNHSFTTSDNIYSLNSSSITAEASSKIEADNNSTLVCTSSNAVKASNYSSVTVINATNVTFNNIQQNLASIGFNLTNVEITRNTSIGKQGFTSTTNPAGTISLISYKDFTEQDFIFNANNNTLTINLSNPISQARGIFRIRYKGTGVNNTITVTNSGTPIFNIEDNNKNNTVEFSYNTSTGLFEMRNIESAFATQGKTVQFNGLSTGQTNFNLGTPITVAPELEMFVNGIKQLYGLDFYYDSTLGQAIFLNRYYTLSGSDEVEFVVY